MSKFDHILDELHQLRKPWHEDRDVSYFIFSSLLLMLAITTNIAFGWMLNDMEKQ